MIDYVEIRNEETKLIGIIDAFNSVIWHSKYFGVGDFEIYTQATPEALAILKKGYYVTRPNDIETGIIEKINITNDEQNGLMIAAAGRFYKSVLDRRLIYNLSGNSNAATVLRGNVEENIRKLVSNNAIACPFDSRRNISRLELGAFAGISAIIIDENGNAAQKQVSYGNLLEYTDGVLEEYGLASVCLLDTETGKFQYIVYGGIDRSINNASGNIPVVFSQEFDNLTASEYGLDTTPEKNTALIGGEGEGLARFYSLIAGNKTDLQRREVFIDASSINKAYKDENEEEKTYTDAEYTALLNTQGTQSLETLKTNETFAGTIDIINGNYVYNRDFALGDIVSVEDNFLQMYINVRICEITEVQDENGYKIDAVYKS
jgi:hypothetical protein